PRPPLTRSTPPSPRPPLLPYTTLFRSGDVTSQVSTLVERALGAGRAVTLVTDGRIDDPERLLELPSGSSVVLLDGGSRRDAAVGVGRGHGWTPLPDPYRLPPYCSNKIH